MPDEITIRTADPLPPDVTSPDLTYSSKIPPDHPGLKLDHPQSRFLKKGPALAVAVVLTVTVGVAVAFAVSPGTASPERGAASTLPQGEGYKNFRVSDVVQSAPGNDAPLRPHRVNDDKVPRLGPPVHGNTSPGANGHLGSDPATASVQSEALRQAVQEENTRALASPILASLDDPTSAQAQQPPSTRASSRDGTLASAGTEVPMGGGPAPSERPASDQNMQHRKNDFLKRDGVADSDYLTDVAAPPRSPYEVKAGTIIPTTLLTGINSDLPGQIIGQVRENVYDTVNGEHLLIPQGARLLAAYDSMVAFGQDRILVCWNRLIRPDGISLRLQCMPGADLAGYSGFADQVDHHWWRILSGVALGSLLAATAQRSQGDISGVQPTFPQLWANNTASGINQAGQQITQKNLQIQPTITIRPGFSVNVIVSKDMILPPYER